METTEFQELIKQKIGNLRPKLLDLSRRNPLIAAKLSPRSNALVRIVDELPDVLFYKLNNGTELRLVPLPELDEDPRDEEAKPFRDALANAQITNEEYLAELEGVDADADDYEDRIRGITRALKDSVRAELGMPERPRKAETNLVQHARNNGIAPSYELPVFDKNQQNERHADDDIQTLLLPKDLERKLNSVSSKCRTWVQETGINVLHIAYGFLEWSEPNQTETAFAPIILAPLQIEKRRSRNGTEFWILGDGDEPEVNPVFAEKLKEFGVELPIFDGASIEVYLRSVSELAPKNLVWRARRQIAIGVFPSARMAMYDDLDPAQQAIVQSTIVNELLAGTNAGGASPFAEEYNVDEPDVEKVVPFTVLDADSSQFSTLVDIARGKNIAVEGPPGTGKSQTIVNAIASALSAGKKVLFVAEKLAALNVVKARLEAIGLGEFLLPLQAERSTREKVIASVRDRVEMSRPAAIRDYDAQLADYRRIRGEIAGYIEVLTTKFSDTGMTVHEILGKGILTNSDLQGVSPDVLTNCSIAQPYLNAAGLKRLSEMVSAAERACTAANEASDIWKGTQLLHPDKFSVEDICNLALRGSSEFSALADARSGLRSFGLDVQIGLDHLRSLAEHLQEAEVLPETIHPVLSHLSVHGSSELSDFIENCDACALETLSLAKIIDGDISERVQKDLEFITSICEVEEIEALDISELEDGLAARHKALGAARALSESMKPLMLQRSDAAMWSFSDIEKAFHVIKKAGHVALALRDPNVADAPKVALLKKLIFEGRVLLQRRSVISKAVSLTADASLEAVTTCASTIRAGGFLSLLSGDYRRALRQARSWVLAVKASKTVLLRSLEELVSYRLQEREFIQNPQAAVVFGAHFRGADTDFEPFEALVLYHEAVNSAFGALDKRPIRTFLREAELDELELVPFVPSGLPIETYETLQQNLHSVEGRLGRLGNAINALKPVLPVLRSPVSLGPDEMPNLVARVSSLIKRQRDLQDGFALAHLLGNDFRGWKTSTDVLKQACIWAARLQSYAPLVSAVLSSNALSMALAQIARVRDLSERASASLHELCRRAEVSDAHFAAPTNYTKIAEMLHLAAHDGDGLFCHAAFAAAVEDLRDTGIIGLIDDRLKRENDLFGIADQANALAARTLARQVYAVHGKALSRYSGAKLDELRAALARKDREIIELSRRQLRHLVHSNSHPPQGNGAGKKSTWTQMALIENEIGKQQRFISVRDLTERAGRALQALKPCWMMSPLAVAQYVKKGMLQFDLCIIDEASQMPPEAAIGALLRSGQTVIVGDTNQLPPSSFFKKMIDDEDANEDEAVLDESVLEMANSTFRPSRRLRWHYRSRHSGLIKFSNSFVYDNNLVVFPSANESTPSMGVEFRAVEGFYKSGTNAIEARAIVDAVVDFMRTDPGRSLGIVTLNQKQRELIAEEFEHALSRDSAAVSYVEAWKEKNDGLEEFFIKNLENVQGDERDVIFIGTVYGPESKGARVMQRFGPINGLAGKRRLNVLFSRAKQKIVTFSSMSAADILADEDGNPGVFMLKRWLEYAATGVLESGNTTEREPDSEFEVFVINQIRAMGCEAVPQVGVARYFVDIGIRHPNWAHGFIMGVECDGASYHSAKSARDRDRLRQEVLEGLGWRLHRIWSTDWFNNPRREGERLRAAITARMDELKAREAEFSRAIEIPERSDASTAEELEQTIPVMEIAKTSSIELKPTKPRTGVDVGDTVRVRYLNDDRKTLQVTISKSRNDVGDGVIYFETPIAKALFGAEEGDEVEVLIGSYVRPAVIESIVKGGG